MGGSAGDQSGERGGAFCLGAKGVVEGDGRGVRGGRRGRGGQVVFGLRFLAWVLVVPLRLALLVVF